MPPKSKFLRWNSQSLTNRAREDVGKCQIKTADVGDVRYPTVKYECRLLASNVTAIREGEHAVAPSVALRIALDVSGEHRSTSALRPRPTTEFFSLSYEP